MLEKIVKSKIGRTGLAGFVALSMGCNLSESTTGSDNSPPNTKMHVFVCDKSNGLYTTPNTIISFQSKDSDGEVDHHLYRLENDSGLGMVDWKEFRNEFLFLTLTEGNYNVYAKAVDDRGLADPNVVEYEFSVRPNYCDKRE